VRKSRTKFVSSDAEYSSGGRSECPKPGQVRRDDVVVLGESAEHRVELVVRRRRVDAVEEHEIRVLGSPAST